MADEGVRGRARGERDVGGATAALAAGLDACPYAELIGTAERDETLLAGAAQYPEGLVSVACYADDFPTVETLANAEIAAAQDAVGR